MSTAVISMAIFTCPGSALPILRHLVSRRHGWYYFPSLGKRVHCVLFSSLSQSRYFRPNASLSLGVVGIAENKKLALTHTAGPI